MECKFDQNLLSFYLDNEVSEEETRKIELHLKECEKCRRKLSELRNVSSILNELETVEVSSDYDRSFSKKFNQVVARKEKSQEPKITPWERWKLWEEVKSIISGASTVAKVTVTAVFVMIVGYTLFALRPGSFPTVITAKGNIQKYNKEMQSWQLIESGNNLHEGDIIKAAENSFIDIELDGIYKMRIKPESEILAKNITRSRREGVTQFELIKGNLLVKIDKPLDKSKFQVKTPFGIAEAKGTEFMVNMKSIDSQTLLGVAEGSVLVKTVEKECLVNKDEKVIVSSSGVTRGPYPLEKEDEEDLKEIKQIGKIFVVLGISDTPQRTKELLSPARLYAYGKYPIEVGDMLDRVLVLLSRASKTDNRELHLSSIEKLRKIIEQYPNEEYNPQILLFLGAYYEYLSLHSEAIQVFEQTEDKYKGTKWGTIAMLAQGIIYEEKLEEISKAKEIYDKILTSYPESPEAKFVKEKLFLNSL